MDVKIRSTTILGVRKKGQIAIGGDGQVTFGDMAFKQKAIKVREFDSKKESFLGDLPAPLLTPSPSLKNSNLK